MAKMIKQAYPVTIMVGKGKSVPPGTPVALPDTEALRLAEAFGTVEASARPAAARRADDAGVAALEKAVSEKADVLARAAEAAEKDPTVENVAAMQQAQSDLAAAENALKAAA